MEITELTWRLIFLFTPGIIATLILDHLVVHKEWNSFHFLIRSLVMGFLTYLAYQTTLIMSCFVHNLVCSCTTVPQELAVWSALISKDTPIEFQEILWSSLTSIFVAFVVSAFINKKLLSRFARFIRLSTKFADDNVWSYYLNSKDITWLWVRRPDIDLVYEGAVGSFSDINDVREIVLYNVKVFSNSTSDLLYEVPSVYLCGDSATMLLEEPISNKKMVQPANNIKNQK